MPVETEHKSQAVPAPVDRWYQSRRPISRHPPARWCGRLTDGRLILVPEIISARNQRTASRPAPTFSTLSRPGYFVPAAVVTSPAPLAQAPEVARTGCGRPAQALLRPGRRHRWRASARIGERVVTVTLDAPKSASPRPAEVVSARDSPSGARGAPHKWGERRSAALLRPCCCVACSGGLRCVIGRSPVRSPAYLADYPPELQWISRAEALGLAPWRRPARRASRASLASRFVTVRDAVAWVGDRHVTSRAFFRKRDGA
jgi:hypothetical protein